MQAKFAWKADWNAPRTIWSMTHPAHRARTRTSQALSRSSSVRIEGLPRIAPVGARWTNPRAGINTPVEQAPEPIVARGESVH